jgi:hypothetical protein
MQLALTVVQLELFFFLLVQRQQALHGARWGTNAADGS